MNTNKLGTTISVIALMLGSLGIAGTAQADVISNGTIQVGVNELGHLNTPYEDGAGGTDPLGIGYVGLRYLPTSAASTEPGCLCEGWGVALRSAGTSGYANEASGTANLTGVSFTSTATTAVSVVNATTTGLQVTHDYHPIAATSNLYEVTVSITNNTGSAIAAGDLVYRRVMDWDIYPTPFSEYVTIGGVPALLGIANGSNVAQTDNNGFNSSDPLSFSSYGQHNVNFTDAGPSDHGALFDFEFVGLAAGATLTFNTYYGATPDEATADAVRALVGMNLYSYGQSSAAADSATTGLPNTFIFGFGTTSGGVFTPPGGGTAPIPEPETYAMLMAGLGLLGAVARRRKQKAA